MDGIKLKKWQDRFLSGVQAVKIQYDSYFRSRSFEECFILETDELSETLKLSITDPGMPNDVKKRLEDLLIASKPDDSV